MSFVAENDLFKEGCIIRYDDWLYGVGENLAHFEVMDRFGLKFEQIETRFMPLLKSCNILFKKVR